jgi:ribonuclease HI
MGALREEWETLLDLVKEKTNISAVWVRGHAGDKVNHFADRAAKQAAQQFTAMIKSWATTVPVKLPAADEAMACVV